MGAEGKESSAPLIEEKKACEIIHVREDEQALSKTERRRIARKRKKEKIALERTQQSLKNPKSVKRDDHKKMTHEQRKAKYTARAREKRDRKLVSKRFADAICFYCREKGHAAMDCPQKKDTHTPDCDKICYKCGSTEHALRDCHKFKKALAQLARNKNKANTSFFKDGNQTETQQSIDGQDPDMPIQAYVELPYAKCFVCGDMGHLSSVCTKNPNGLYVTGGSCRHCESKFHLAKDCPNKDDTENDKEDAFEIKNLEITPNDGGGDDIPLRSEVSSKKSKKKKTVTF